MPEITESTPRDTITIAGNTFTVPKPYAEGHALSSNEAAALNQTYAENLRNNFASKVKAAQEAGTFDLSVFQGSFDDYASEYEFGVRSSSGGRSGDPVQAEALNIARDLVRKALVKKGHKLADIKASQITDLAKGVLARGDDKAAEILRVATERVAAQTEIAGIEIDSLEPSEAEAAPAKKGKATAEAPAEPVE